MKIKVRGGLFETNSSSAHVFVVGKHSDLLTEEDVREEAYIRDGELLLYFTDVDDGYGRWPFQLLATFTDKVAYALCEYCGCLQYGSKEFNENYQMVLNVVREILPEIDDFQLKSEKVCPYLDKDGNQLGSWEVHYRNDGTGNYKEMYEVDGEWYEAKEADYYIDEPQIGCIDHQSAGMLKNFLARHEITLREFLLNKKYMIFVDGDEYHEFDKFVKYHIINLNDFEEVE